MLQRASPLPSKSLCLASSTSSGPLSLDISLGQGGFRYLLSHMAELDTDPRRYSQGFTYSDAGSIGKQAEMGYQRHTISSVIKSDSKIHTTSKEAKQSGMILCISHFEDYSNASSSKRLYFDLNSLV